MLEKLSLYATIISAVIDLVALYFLIKRSSAQESPKQVSFAQHNMLRRWSIGQTFLFILSGIAFICSLWFCAMNVTYLYYFKYFGPEPSVGETYRSQSMLWVMIFSFLVLWSLILFIRTLRQPKRGRVVS